MPFSPPFFVFLWNMWFCCLVVLLFSCLVVLWSCCLVVCSCNNETKHSTKQQNNQTTKQPDNQTTKQQTSLPILGVDDDGDGAVIEQFYLHVSSKLARTYLLAYCGAQLLAESLVERDADVVRGGTKPGRPVSLLA